MICARDKCYPYTTYHHNDYAGMKNSQIDIQIA